MAQNIEEKSRRRFMDSSGLCPISPASSPLSPGSAGAPSTAPVFAGDGSGLSPVAGDATVYTVSEVKDMSGMETNQAVMIQQIKLTKPCLRFEPQNFSV